ncbi:hypothetical protein [Halorubrum halodurans]|uniref:Uncharacterized protein n=1 Tax=Halorubrum halodurans TaxID=1383851 RepID=A0A256IKF5_9EURY|nr:hypothetical protein [Halorubrum halodurans]OYR56642.1 hypothetical protein DJ70_07970 [Halorubrum halodurans]
MNVTQLQQQFLPLKIREVTMMKAAYVSYYVSLPVFLFLVGHDIVYGPTSLFLGIMVVAAVAPMGLELYSWFTDRDARRPPTITPVLIGVVFVTATTTIFTYPTWFVILTVPVLIMVLVVLAVITFTFPSIIGEQHTAG